MTTSLPAKAALSLAKLEQLLADLAALGPIMIQAIENDDDARLLACLQQARGLRARLRASGALAHAEAGSLTDVERLRELVAGARVAEKIADRWLARPLPPEEELLATPGGEVFLADAMLPAVWDFERDLVVLVGAGVSPLAAALRQLGQERILWYIPDGDGDGDGVGEGDGDGVVAEPSPALRVEGADELVMAVRAFGIEMPESLVVRALDPERRAACGEVERLFRGARDDMQIHRNTVVTFNRTWLEQGMTNLPAVCRWPSVAALDDELVKRPLVIIAPGPSLSRNVHLLAELKGKAVLLAVSHALTALTRAGIVPDFVLAVDPQDVRYHYAGNPLDEVAAVINGTTVHPGLFELGAPRYLWLAANGQLDDWLGDLVGEQARVGGGGSVATTAFTLAMRWGCDPIAMVGLDLSFPGGKYYVESSCDGEARAVLSRDGRSVAIEGWSKDFYRMKENSTAKRSAERVVELPGWHGEPVPSSFMFTLFHRWFEERLRALDGAAEVFNCTEGGAHIEGMQHVPLAAFAERVARSVVDPAGAVSRAVERVHPGERMREVTRRLGDLATALRRCRAAARRCTRMAGRHGANGGDTDRLASAERDLVQRLGSLQFLSMMAQREIGEAVLGAREVMTVAEAVQKSTRMFELVDESAGWLVPRVLGARHAVLQAASRPRP